MLMTPPTGGDSFTGNSGFAYSAATGVSTNIGPGDVRQALLRNWNESTPQGPSIDNQAMVRWKRAVARGAPNIARLLVIGDSTTTGEGAGTSTANMVGARSQSWPALIAAAKGWQDASLIGDQNASTTGVTLPQYDPRVTFGTGWASDAGISSLGGRFITAPAASAGALTFTPGKFITRIKIWYPQTASANTAMVVKADGVTLGTINQTGSNAISSVTYSISRAQPVISITIGATGTGFVQGIECWDHTNPAPSILIAGICGGLMADMAAASSPWSQLNALTAYAADAVMVNCTVNDINGGTGADGTYANLALVINATIAAGGDIVTVMGNSSNVSTYASLSPGHARLLKSSALAYSGAFSDPVELLGYWAEANARSLMYDANHPNAAGYALIASQHGSIF